MFLRNYQNSKQLCKSVRPICKQEESGSASSKSGSIYAKEHHVNINGIPSAKTNFQRRPDVKDVIVFRAEDKRRLIFLLLLPLLCTSFTSGGKLLAFFRTLPDEDTKISYGWKGLFLSFDEQHNHINFWPFTASTLREMGIHLKKYSTVKKYFNQGLMCLL